MAGSAEDAPVETRTDHRCVLAVLTRRLGEAHGDRAALAADALSALLRDGTFDRCCAPRYRALAPERASREVQIPVAKENGIEARVIVWPVGAGDATHPHADGWTVFVPVSGELHTVERGAGGAAAPSRLEPRRPVVLRPEDRVRHRVGNGGDAPALSVHVSGPS